MSSIEQIIAKLLKEGKSYSYISALLGTSPKRISRVKKFMNMNGQVPKPLKIGRPIIITQQIMQFVGTETKDDPRSSCKKIRTRISQNLNVQISETMIRYMRHDLGFVYGHPRKRQALTNQQIEKRIQFCEKQLKEIEKWKSKIIISDESRFGIYPDNRMLWLKIGDYQENTFASSEKFSQTLMVWGCIGFNYKSKLIIIRENLNSAKYIEMLQKMKYFCILKQV